MSQNVVNHLFLNVKPGSRTKSVAIRGRLYFLCRINDVLLQFEVGMVNLPLLVMKDLRFRFQDEY